MPGCGSTFTRHFNLKGHLRSHNDERPFKCLYEGCPKGIFCWSFVYNFSLTASCLAIVGFARQHDCKRHMLLHEGLRLFECEGCGKKFARLDALTRHREPTQAKKGCECADVPQINLNKVKNVLSHTHYLPILMAHLCLSLNTRRTRASSLLPKVAADGKAQQQVVVAVGAAKSGRRRVKRVKRINRPRVIARCGLRIKLDISFLAIRMVARIQDVVIFSFCLSRFTVPITRLYVPKSCFLIRTNRRSFLASSCICAYN